MIVCARCKKEFYGKFCPQCGAPAGVAELSSPVVVRNTIPEKRKGSCLKTILIAFGLLILLGLLSNIVGGSEKNEKVETETMGEIKEFEENQKQKKMEEKNSKETESAKELQESEEEFENIKDSFEQGFNDNFEISDENQENIDSIKENVDEIVNDPEVQDAYEDWKDSVKNLFGIE